MEYLHSYLFGERGARTFHSTYDVLSSSANATVLETISRDTPRHSSVLMRVALSLYETKLKNTWAKNKLLNNKARNKLLEILLRIHRAPKRESHHYEKLKEERRPKEQQAKKQARKKIAKSRRNTFHNAIRSEKYKLQRYQRKAQGKPEGNNWARLAEHGQDRINRMYADFKRANKKEAAASSGQALDPASSSTAASAVLRKLLVKQAGKAISHAQLKKKERRDITDDEARVCLLLSKILLPYIPTAKGHHSYIGFQLPFMLLANDIFCAVGYGKFEVNLCPTFSCGSLHVMRLDAISVYTLCTKGDDPVDVFDFEGYHMPSVEAARAHK
ncbi:hypothetical protein FB192DRAFT_1338954 [Mucor lusitanicus]|uniref:Uncharacterized protein n=1 Tax=Mucor circinelloides f. lusitanicus TaxID=29924 RepID=A0A8H4F633_MUCCL|nr:hypothetical protein FB192DRAFT_1338954 [Mucor lusitanicus]